MLRLLLLVGIAAALALGKACTAPHEGCDIPVKDETVLLQVGANVSRHRSLSNATSGPPKYSLFLSRGTEPGNLEIQLDCPNQPARLSTSDAKGAPIGQRAAELKVYSLTVPIIGGDSGVLYHIKDAAQYLVKFSRSMELEDGFKDEIQLATLFPDFTPGTWKCQATVQKYESQSGNMMTVQRGSRDFTFPVLVKDLIQGTGLENVLMTLSSPESSKGSGDISQPKTCPLDTRTSKFNRAKYNLVKSLVPGRHRRVTLSASLPKEFNCIMGLFAGHCSETHEAVRDLKPQNWVYGKRNGQGDAKLFVVDAAIVSNVQAPNCVQVIVGDLVFPAGQPVNDDGDTCLGPYWKSWVTPDMTIQGTRQMAALKGQCG